MSFDDEVRGAVRYERLLLVKALATLTVVALLILLHRWLE